MKTHHKLFFAVPFDSATKILYEKISSKIRDRYPGVTTVIGNYEMGPSPNYSDIATFKAQNRELTDQIVRQIQDADIVVADLSHNNPNVHVELGVALVQNKNILRVTGRPLTELGFDIRNFQMFPYQDESQLNNKIESYLDTFFKIKGLPLMDEYPSLYYQEPSAKLEGAADGKLVVRSRSPRDFIMRDGAVHISFEFLNAPTEDDWFGFYFRAGDNPWIGSHLLYVRQSGKVEIVVYPGQSPIETWDTGQQLSGTQELTAQFENNYLEVQLNRGQSLQTEKLSHQAPGRVLPAAWRADVDVHSLEMICRDTIEWY